MHFCPFWKTIVEADLDEEGSQRALDGFFDT